MVSKTGVNTNSYEIKPANDPTKGSHLQNEKEKVNLVIKDLNLPNKTEGITSKGILGPLLALFLVGRGCKRNRDAHLRNENTKPDGTTTINPDRQKMGIGERLGLFPIEKNQIEVNGVNVEVTYYPRMGEKSAIEITSGPSELVGMTIDNLNCHQPDWKDQAKGLLQEKIIQRLKPPSTSAIKAKNPLDFIDIKDQSQNQQTQKIDDKISQTRENREKVFSNPEATPVQRQEAIQQFSNAFEEKIARRGDLVPDKGSFKEIILSNLEKKESQAKNNADTGKKHLETAHEITQLMSNHENKARLLQTKLDQNPNAAEITLNLPDGKVKVVSRKQVKQKIEKLKQKGSTLERKQVQHTSDGIKKAPLNRAKEKVASEAAHQIQNMGQTMKVGGLFCGADAIMDVIEGKSDVSTAICDTAVNTLVSTAVSSRRFDCL